MGMWHGGVQMAGVLLIRELDFLSSEGEEESPGRCSTTQGGILSVCCLRENLKNPEGTLENHRKLEKTRETPEELKETLKNLQLSVHQAGAISEKT